MDGIGIGDTEKSVTVISIKDENSSIVSDVPDNDTFVTDTKEFEDLANKALESVKNDLLKNNNNSSSISQANSSTSSSTTNSNSDSVPVITQTSNVSQTQSDSAVGMMEDIYSVPVYESIPNTGIGDKEISTNYSIPVIAGVIGGAGIGLGLREKMKDEEKKKETETSENN